MTVSLWPLVLYAFLVLLLVSGIMIFSVLLGERHRDRATDQAYESGIKVTGSARVRLNVNFFLMAVFFVIFDLEAVFIFGWAVAIREAGWAGYAEIVVFIAILFAALVYLWRVGGLELRDVSGGRASIKGRVDRHG